MLEMMRLTPLYTLWNGSSNTARPSTTGGDEEVHWNDSSGDDRSCIIDFPLGQGSIASFVEGIGDRDKGLAVMNRIRKAASRTISLESITL